MCFHCSSNILSLSLIFTNLIIEHLDVVLFELILFGTLWFLDLDVCFLYHIREVFSYYFFKYIPSPLISSSEAPIIWMLVYMIFSQRSLILFSFLFIYYYFLRSFDISTTISSSLLIHPYMSSNLLLISSRLLFISVIIFFISIWFFYTFSKSVRKF